MMNNGKKLKISSLPIKQDVRQNQVIARCSIPFFGLLVVVLLGVICQKNVMVHGKPFMQMERNGITWRYHRSTSRRTRL